MLPYTPRLSDKHSDIVRRMSWAFGIPMTKILKNMIELASIFVDKKQICKNCKDKKSCIDCFFKNKPRTKLPGKRLIFKKSKYQFIKVKEMNSNK